MEHYRKEDQLTGHVSQATCFETDCYILNGTQTPVRYWIETNPSYGQRVIRQIYNTRLDEWFNPKHITKYVPVTLLFSVVSAEDFDNNVVYGASLQEPVRFVQYSLNEEAFDIPGSLQQFLDYYTFDEYQRRTILARMGEPVEPIHTVAAPRRSGSGNSTLEQLRQAKLEYELERLRTIRLKNDALELRVNARRQRADLKQDEIATGAPEPDDAYKKLSTHYARTSDGFNKKQLEELKQMALADPTSLPGNLQPFHLAVMNPIQLAFEASKAKVDPRQHRAESLAKITDPEAYERKRQMHERMDSDYEATLRYYTEQNLAWYEANKPK